jgi:hypothetical protein
LVAAGTEDIMRTHSVGLALIALVMVLAGCRVSVHSGFVDLAPGSLVEYKLEFTNTLQHDPATSTINIPTEVTYFFWDEDVARNPEIRIQAKDWSYRKNRYDMGTVQVVFALTRITDLITTCRLTFEAQDHGTHRCEVEEKDTGTMQQQTVSSGWSEGTFRLERIE